ncbi:MAG: hypothetical protein IJV14_11460, partial [Lachnospiraceae bacterium]|nr:hypothetical protein [Lachnospiraceae bacterium]
MTAQTAQLSCCRRRGRFYRHYRKRDNMPGKKKTETKPAAAVRPEDPELNKPGDPELNKQESPDLKSHHTILRVHLDDAYYSENPKELEEILQELNDRLDCVGIRLTASR